MAYGDDIDVLSPDHRWSFDNVLTDSVGSVTITNTGCDFVTTPLCEDSTYSIQANGTTSDRLTVPSTTDINNSAQTRKCIAGWFMVSKINLPPTRIYGEGNTTCFQMCMAHGNTMIFEVRNSTSVQVFSDLALTPNRAYHLTMIFEGNGYANELRCFIDGVKQLNALPSDREPDFASIAARSPVEFGDPIGTVSIGGTSILLVATVNAHYAQWASWNDANAVLTDTEVREELFEKGALPDETITTDTESNMQSDLNSYITTVSGETADSPLNIRVEPLSGGGDLTLEANNLVFDDRASIHVQYTGTNTLTWINKGTTNATIFSTPNGGTVINVQETTITITVKNVVSGAVVSGARVLIVADAGGDLTEGDSILTGTTNASGVITTTFNYTSDQPIVGVVRQGTSSTYYVSGIIAGPITEEGLTETVLLIPDEDE